ncbi:potassium voltage-gated channel subfamily H member 8 [Apis dorsata]|nr:potassium voltage-gated channel subfamily H member 8 [Apis dorsata]
MRDVRHVDKAHQPMNCITRCSHASISCITPVIPSKRIRAPFINRDYAAVSLLADSNFVLGNAQVPSLYPIVYCSDGFCELTGFARAQIMQKGCACKFLYGPETKEEERAMIDKSLESKTELKMEVVFYKKNGSPFDCLLDIVPIKNEKGDVVLFLASHKDITHTKNLQLCELQDSDAKGGLDPEAPPANYGRRRSRAVLYQLSGHYKQDNKHKIKLNNNLLHSTAPPLPEYKTTGIKKSQFILSHYGGFKSCWDWLILLATFYVAIVVPFNASFINIDRPTMVSDVVVEALFITDIVLNFRTTYVSRKGEVVSNSKSIAVNYLKGWFFVDLVAALPFDFLYASDVYSGEVSNLIIASFDLLSTDLRGRDLATVDIIDETRHPFPGWIHTLAENLKISVEHVTHAESYITALYFTCSSLTPVGFGNASANTFSEKFFSICTMLIGALMHAVVFGNVTAIIQRIYSRRSLYQTKLRDLKDFFVLHQIPEELKQRMQDYFQTMWSLNHGIDIHETLKQFPEELRGDVSMHLHREILNLPIFEPASQGCLKLLSLRIKNNFCAPGEFLVHKGDALSYIYYLCNGSMEVVQNNMVVAILGKGDLVGCDINVHLQHTSNGGGAGGGGAADVVVKSSCDVKALTYCDLKCINMHGLVEVLRLYPEYQHQFANDIQHDLTYNLREGYEAEQESDMNGPSLTLPSISEDDENVPDEGETSPLSPPNKSPLHTSSSPRHAKFRDEYREARRPARGVLVRGRTAQVIAQESMEEHIRGSVERLDTQFSTLHQDVATLSCEVRNAIQALQILACSPQSNPNLPTPASRGSGVLARSSSHPPDAICWDPPRRMLDASTQTDWPVDLFESWVRANSQTVLRILELDPDLLLRQPHSPTPSPSSPPPPPYEPLSPVVGTPPRSLSPAQGNETFVFGNNRGEQQQQQHIPRSYKPTNSTWDPENKLLHRFSAGDADNASLYQAFSNLRRLPESRSLKFDPFDS